jgi:hypothetical protein
MRSHQTSRVSVASVAGVILFGSLLAGCAEEPEASPSETMTPPASSSSTPTPTTEPSDGAAGPSILEVPAVTDKEIARALFQLADDTSTSPNTVEDAVVADEPLLLEGACVGEDAMYRITSAAVDGDEEVLRNGILRCDEALYVEFSLDVDGPVQLSFTNTDDIDEGWLLLTRVD